MEAPQSRLEPDQSAFAVTAIFPFSVSPKGSNGCHIVLLTTEENVGIAEVPDSCSFTSVTPLTRKAAHEYQQCCMACAGTPKIAAIFCSMLLYISFWHR